jgi:glutathione S-transferase
MITLYTFGPYFQQPDGSPFVIKAMILLKMAGLAFVEKRSAPFTAPKGKLPFIDDDGERIADSTFIRFHIQKKYGFDYDAGLTPEQKATGWALEKMLEDHVYWLVLVERWLDDGNFDKGPASFFKAMPAPMRPLVKSLVRGKIRKAAVAQGLFRHNEEERRILARRALESVSVLLGERPFLFGDEPRGADATLGAFALAALSPTFNSAVRDELRKFPSLCSYASRIEQRYFANPA